MDNTSNNKIKTKTALFVSPVIPQKDGIGIEQRAYRNLNLLTEDYSVDVILIGKKTDNSQNIGLPIVNLYWVDDLYIDIPTWMRKIPGAYILWRVTIQNTSKIRVWKNRANVLSHLGSVLKNHYKLCLFFRINTVWLYPILRRFGSLDLSSSIVDFDDIESKAIKRSLSTSRSKRGNQKFISSFFEMLAMKSREKDALKTFDYIWVCSENDKKELEKSNFCKAKIVNMPNTIYLPDVIKPSEGKSRILFVGAMSYFPNIDASQYFCTEVFPALMEKLEGCVEFYIVGGPPAEEVMMLSRIDGVTVTGRVGSVKKYYEEADLVVVPIRFGGGTRIKILEAMAYGRLVISTTVGCEGLAVEHGKQLIIADTSEQFIEDCLFYLSNSSARSRIIENARDFVKSNYGYRHAVSIFRGS